MRCARGVREGKPVENGGEKRKRTERTRVDGRSRMVSGGSESARKGIGRASGELEGRVVKTGRKRLGQRDRDKETEKRDEEEESSIRPQSAEVARSALVVPAQFSW